MSYVIYVMYLSCHLVFVFVGSVIAPIYNLFLKKKHLKCLSIGQSLIYCKSRTYFASTITNSLSNYILWAKCRHRRNVQWQMWQYLKVWRKEKSFHLRDYMCLQNSIKYFLTSLESERERERERKRERYEK